MLSRSIFFNYILVRPRFQHMSNRWAFLIVLLGLGTALISTNPWFTVLDDECVIITAAAQPLSSTVDLCLGGGGQREHPPLYDLIFHVWLSFTNGNIHLLRIPVIVFYLLGICALAGAGKCLSQDKGVTPVEDSPALLQLPVGTCTIFSSTLSARLKTCS